MICHYRRLVKRIILYSYLIVHIYSLSPRGYPDRSKATPARNYKNNNDNTELDPPWTSTKASNPIHTVSNVHELRSKVLDERLPLKQIKINMQPTNYTTSMIHNHEVIQLIARRYHDNSLPGQRNDDCKLALSIEGGGMRGAVSAGMAAAVACLGLTNTIDSVYGSSAGSVIGAYLVSRQVCMDVYVDILTAAKRTFVCTRRMLSNLAITGLDGFVKKRSLLISKWAQLAAPGMNISFVLDGIMHHEHGIRPLDMNKFLHNDKIQPLNIASSYVDKDGKLMTKCFTSQDFGENTVTDNRSGLYACLEPSMTVPGATGPPVNIKNIDSSNTTTTGLPHFDAFCFEPLPYRSAVNDNATHVLVLCSRPADFVPKTKQGVYERGVASIYFRSHGQDAVAQFFEKGGQQYIYAEDLLTMRDGEKRGVENYEDNAKICIPPPILLYGVDNVTATDIDRNNWKRAHLLPIQVPAGTLELPTLAQDRELVLEAVRGGFAAAYNMLAPIIGPHASSICGLKVAKLVFPNDDQVATDLLQRQLRIEGKAICAMEKSIQALDDNDEIARIRKALPGLEQLPHLARHLMHNDNPTTTKS